MIDETPKTSIYDCLPLAPVRYFMTFAGIETEMTPTFDADGRFTGWTGEFGPFDEIQARAIMEATCKGSTPKVISSRTGDRPLC